MIVLIDKPSGHTSYDLIRKMKKIYPKTKIGHAGTLDPLASGMMIIAVGKDTKKLSTFIGLDKQYEATIDFSQCSDTWDSDARQWHLQLGQETKTLNQQDKKQAQKRGWNLNNTLLLPPSYEDIKKHLESIIGDHQLPLTPFSAKKIDGVKLYEHARQGNPIHINVPMTIKSYEILDYTFPHLRLRIDVGSGTYIRSIAYRLGNSFGLGGIITSLRRISIGKYQF